MQLTASARSTKYNIKGKYLTRQNCPAVSITAVPPHTHGLATCVGTSAPEATAPDIVRVARTWIIALTAFYWHSAELAAAIMVYADAALVIGFAALTVTAGRSAVGRIKNTTEGFMVFGT